MRLYEGELDDTQLSALVDDLTACAHIEEVRVKGDARAHSARGPGLSDAIAALVQGRVRAVQILYQHDGQGWCDTLLGRGERIRLVRNQIPDSPES